MKAGRRREWSCLLYTSSIYGNFFTPRFHVKYSPVDAISIRLSAGKGYRTVFGLSLIHISLRIPLSRTRPCMR